jgi:hypothetical protein
MTLNKNVIAICVTSLICAGCFLASVLSINATILQAATIQGQMLSPALTPRDHNVTVEGTVLIGNRKGGSLDMGVTLGKDKE